MGLAVRDHLDVPLKVSPFLRLLERDDLDELNEVLETSQALLSADAAAQLAQVEEYASATNALNVVWQAVSAALAGGAQARDRLLDSTDLMDLLGRVRRLDVVLRDAEARRRHSALDTVRTALGRFQTVGSMQQLIELAPEVICALGFDRAIISRIENSTWVTQAVHIVGDREWAATISKVGQENPQPLSPDLRETEIVRRRTSMLVTGVQQDAHVHRPVADASLSRSYVAAPVMLRNNVIGFLHSDRFFHRGDTDEFDRDMLGLFSEGLSYAMERTLLMSRLDGMRREVRRAMGGIESMFSPSGDDAGDVFADDAAASAGDRPSAQLFDFPVPRENIAGRLTQRELQVIKLMAGGETNTQIGERLFLSEGTVKSHVKHILRKFGAANRAEAVSKWLMASTAAHTTL